MFKFEDAFQEEVASSKPAPEPKLDDIGSLARKCMASAEFQAYKDKFQAEMDNILNAMVVYTANFGKSGNENLEIYAVNMIRYVQRITDLRKLITYVELDAKSKKGEEDVKE